MGSLRKEGEEGVMSEDLRKLLRSVMAEGVGLSVILKALTQEAPSIKARYLLRGQSKSLTHQRGQKLHYLRERERLLCWLRYEVRPSELSDSEFQEFRPVTEYLVYRGEMKRNALAAFREPEQSR